MVSASADPAQSPAVRRMLRWIALLGVWLASRALLVAVGVRELPFYPKGPLAFDDLEVYARWLPDLTSGVLPTDDMWQYPPATSFFFLLGQFGPDPATTLMIAIVGVDLVLTIVLAVHRLSAGWFWVLFGLMIGPVLVSRFDVVPTLFAVLAVLSAMRPVVTGMWAAVGAGLKVWPVLVLPVVARRGALSAAAAFVATSVALLAVTAVFFDELTGFLGGQGNRGLQVESVAALPFLIANAVNGQVELAYRYGSMEVASAGAGLAAAVVSVLALAGFVWVIVSWVRGRFEQVPSADVAFTIVLFSVVVSRVFSPQYSIWLLALGTLCLVERDSRLRVPVWLVAIAALITQVLYPSGYGWLLAGDPVMVALQSVRISLVVIAAVWSWYRVVIAPASQIASQTVGAPGSDPSHRVIDSPAGTTDAAGPGHTRTAPGRSRKT